VLMVEDRVRGRVGGFDAAERGALAITVGLILAMAFGLGSSVQLPLALAFVTWVPGTAAVAWMPTLSSAERRGVTITISLSVSVLGSTVLAWSHWWHPGALFLLLAVASVALLVAAPPRERGERAAGSRWRPPGPVAGTLAFSVVAGVIALVQLGREDRVVGEWGLLGHLPLAWYVAAVALVAGAVLSFRCASRIGMASSAVLLVFLLHAPTAVAYAVPRFPWTYKHLGVTDFLLDHGRLQSGIDVYHNWPGFFSVAGFVFDLGGVSEPFTLLRWWPALVGVAAVVVLRFFFGGLTDDFRVLWGAVTLFVIGNWFGQDYFAPQSLAFVLAFGTLGIFLRTSASTERNAFDIDKRERVAYAVAGLVGFGAIVVTHQLSPYLLLPGITVACLLGAIRPRWIFVACAAIALLYLVPRFGWVDSHGGLGETSIAYNIRTPSSMVPGLPTSVRVSNWAMRLLTGLLVAGSLPFLARLRRDRWWTVFMLGNLVGPVCVLAVQAYGNEGLMRSALFMTPWLAFATASSIVTGGFSRPNAWRRSAVWAGALAVGVGLFVTATWGLDARYRVDPAEVRLERAFERSAPTGSMLVQMGPSHLPTRMTSRYPQLTFYSFYPFKTTRDVDAVLSDMQRGAERLAKDRAVYVAWSDSADRLAPLVGAGAESDYVALREAIRRSSRWTVIAEDSGTLLLRFAG
jgi:hypothetical protein